MKALERALVNGEPCVRVPTASTNNICRECPLVSRDKCDSSCGTGFVWVRELAYITELLEGNAASLNGSN